MTESVIELIPNGGAAGWDRMGLGYDGYPIIFPPSYTTDCIFSLVDAAVAGVISKITIAYCINSSETYGKSSAVYGKYLVGSTWTTTGATVVAENDSTWHYIDLATSPGGVAWLWSEVDSIMAGIRVVIPYGGWCNLRQFKLQVTYTPEAYVPPMIVRGNCAVGSGSMML